MVCLIRRKYAMSSYKWGCSCRTVKVIVMPPHPLSLCFSGEIHAPLYSNLCSTLCSQHGCGLYWWQPCCVMVMIAGVYGNHLLAWQDASCWQTNIMLFTLNDESVTPPRVWFFFLILPAQILFFYTCIFVRFRNSLIKICWYHSYICANWSFIHSLTFSFPY